METDKSKPAWHPQARKNMNEAKLQFFTPEKISGNAKVILIGDSMVGRFPQSLLPENIENLGVGSSTTQNWLYFIDNNMVPFDKMVNTNLIVLMLGTNNIHDKKVTPDLLKDGLFEIISIIKSKLPNTKILFISILNRYDKTKTKNKISSNDILLEEIKFTNDLMKSNPDIEYFDLSQYIYEEKYFNEDKLHLNEDGYNLFAEKLIEHINKHYLI
jgi:lysophospholipase L1-like esterase